MEFQTTLQPTGRKEGIMVRYTQDRTIVLGYVPVRRDMFPAGPAIELKDRVKARFDGMAGKCGDVKLVTIDDVVAGGMLWDLHDVDRVTALFQAEKVDAVVFPHCNFGQEEVVAKVAAELGKPVLLWGPRDPSPESDKSGKTGPRDFDTQCGMFATSRALKRYRVPFTYIENCWLDSPVLDRGFEDFIRVVSVVKAFRGMRIGQIGSRPRQFLSVKINESELLSKFGIEIVPIWPEEVKRTVEKLKRSLPPSPEGCELPMGQPELPPLEGHTPDPRIAEVVKEIEASVDCSAIGHEAVEKMAYLEVAVMDLAAVNRCQAVAVDCWGFSQDAYGIPSCFVLGELFDRGLPAACETDIHAAVGAVLLQAASRYASPAFIADVTIRHPEDDNAELLWHCGPFAKSLVKKGVNPSVKECKGMYEIEGGPITVVRFDQDEGDYLLFADEGEGTEGPATTGNYVWFKVNDWVKWEKKLMYGPYIHHVSGIHGQFARVLKEACKYLGPVAHDSVEPVEEM